MDEVLQKFNSALGCDQTQYDPRSGDRGTLYKNWGKFGNQEQRRKEILNSQKGSRYDNLDQFRGIFDLSKIKFDQPVYGNERASYRPNIYVAGFTKTPKTYKNVLMRSEWLVEKPEDFNENWYVVACPKAARVLIVSDRGMTKLYTKYGQFIREVHTALPGGNPGENHIRTGKFSVLDGFYLDEYNTVYVLDLLAWNSQPMTNGEAEFRQYWLKTHLQEIEGINKLSKKNKLTFQLLPTASCEKDSFNEFMMKFPHFTNFNPMLDGLLFYHKLANYTAGQTPLVGWLYPFMVREVLGSDITVNIVYELQKPKNYQNQAIFIEEFTEKIRKKCKPYKPFASFMETETTEMPSASSIYLPIGEHWHMSSITTSGSRFNFEIEAEKPRTTQQPPQNQYYN